MILSRTLKTLKTLKTEIQKIGIDTKNCCLSYKKELFNYGKHVVFKVFNLFNVYNLFKILIVRARMRTWFLRQKGIEV